MGIFDFLKPKQPPKEVEFDRDDLPQEEGEKKTYLFEQSQKCLKIEEQLAGNLKII